jgi:AmmeMemoRadiSam system protein A
MTAERPETPHETAAVPLREEDRRTMLQLAVGAVRDRLHECPVSLPDPASWTEPLRQVRATFVTWRRHGELRGCCGTVRPREPLARDVVRSALSAAFSDPRFSPVDPREFPEFDLHISLLSRPAALAILTEADLVAAVRPGIDGLILSDESHQGVYLPSVWEQVATPREFVRRLKQKAGFAPDHWSPWLRVERFTAESIHGTVADVLPKLPANAERR